MGYIKEPEGIDLALSPIPLTEDDKKLISEIIAEYRKTKKIPKSLRRKKKLTNRIASSASSKEKTRKDNSNNQKEPEIASNVNNPC